MAFSYTEYQQDHGMERSSFVCMIKGSPPMGGYDVAKALLAPSGDADGVTKKEESKPQGKVFVGLLCSTKNLYQKFDEHGLYSWSEKYPDGLEEAAENVETMKHAILVRNKKSYDSRKNLEIHSIVIQSHLLKAVLQDVLKDYPGVTTTLSRLEFSKPFWPFVHRWTELTCAIDNQDYDEQTRSHVKLLHDVLSGELGNIVEATKDYVANRVITYEHVWTIFQPGCVVLATRYGRPVAMRLTHGQFCDDCRAGPAFVLTCERVEWDGSKFGYETSSQTILSFAGTKAIRDLACYPLQYADDAEAIRMMLVARGRQFESLAGYHYNMYTGQAVEQTSWGPSKISVDSRIIIDAFAHGKWNPNHQSALKSLDHNIEARIHQDNVYGYSPNFESDDYDQNDDLELPGSHKRFEPLTEKQLLLCTPMVKGWALKPKKWLEFYVDSVSEIRFHDNAFNSLVLPRGQKSLILAFSQSQTKNKNKVDDVIAGKGKGIIMLLSGGPGIGKTLTAEAVAEEMRVPLYVMSADDLGHNSSTVEEKLQQVLEMVAKWNAVLLLDECDIFLEKRTSSDLDRNRIVGTFLRTLEYYEGILFLTTNRLECIDEAFHSRIHLSLQYPPLDVEARRSVWAGFLDRQNIGGDSAEAAHEVTPDEIAKLAELDLNGRQIRNLLKTSNLLAFHSGEKLAYAHLKEVLNAEGYQAEL